MPRFITLICAISILLPVTGLWAETVMNGRIQYGLLAIDNEDSDVFATADTRYEEQQLDIRLMLDQQQDLQWSFHDQLQALKSDRLTITVPPVVLPLSVSSQLDDRQRLFDLSHTVHNGDDNVLVHRVDRLHIGQTTQQLSWKLGRYAVSWGNGLVYSVMDIFNPFDPASIDKEFKTGDDMLYMQYLYDSGNDLQLLLVPRRDPLTHSVESTASSIAIKYHGLINLNDYDLLLARHYDETLFGLGFTYDIEGVLWRGDVLLSHGDEDDYLSLVSSLSYAWNYGEKPVSGFAEFYYTSFGEHFDEAYQLSDILNNNALLNRLQRGEAYTIGRQYLALGVDLEWHPLLHLMPSLFYNLQDQSSLFQFLLRYDLEQNFIIQFGANLAQGDRGTEYGGIDIVPGVSTLSVGDTWFVQMNYYF